MSVVSHLNQIILTIEGLTCERCATSATKAIKTVRGVDGVCVNLATGQARIAYSSDMPSTEAIISALAARGYVGEAIPPDSAMVTTYNPSLVTPEGCKRITFRVDSLVGAEKLRAIRITLRGELGVQDAGTHRRSDDSNEGIAWAVYDPEITDAGQLRTAIQEQGYKLR